MTCQECELALAGEERSAVVDGHVTAHMAECAACSEFAVELRENSQALRAFAMESMPGLRVSPIGLPSVISRHQQVAWRAAVAAVLVLGFVSSWIVATRHFLPSQSRLESRLQPRLAAPPIEPQQANAVSGRQPAQFRPAASPMRHRASSRSQEKNESRILQIKMLTDDPDVVIYWQIEN